MVNDFNFFVGVDIPDEIYKASKDKKGEDRYKNMIVSGLASDNSEDVEGEFMEPSGFELDEFLKSGLLNLEHFTTRKGSPKFWIGEPISAEIKGNNFFLKGKLWEHHPLAREFWDTVLIMKASGSKRKPGFSIEGKAKERDPMNPKRVTKAKISHVALTFSPVNKNSWLDIVKGEQQTDFIDCELGDDTCKHLNQFQKSVEEYEETCENGDVCEKEKTEKAVTTESVDVLAKESLDKKIKNIVRKSLLSGKISPQKAIKVIKKFK